jgi:hypothetical protein
MESLQHVWFSYGAVAIDNQQSELKGTILVPKISLTNPHVDTANHLSILWSIEKGLFKDEPMIKDKLARERVAALVANSLASGSLDDLKLMTDYLVTTILIDDILDKEFEFQQQLTEERLLQLQAIFDSFTRALGNVYL